jgi:hypothetical protein
MCISAVAGAEDAPVIREPMPIGWAKFRKASVCRDRPGCLSLFSPTLLTPGR